MITAAPPAAPARLLRTRLLLVRIGAGLLTLQLLLNASAGPVGVVSGTIPRPMLLAALLAPVGKVLALGAIAAVAWTAGASAAAVRLWAVGLVVEIVAALLLRQPADALAALLQLVLFGGVLLLLLPDRRRLLPPRPRWAARFVPAAGLGAAAGVWLVVAAGRAATAVPGAGADDLAEARFDGTVLGVAVCAWSLLLLVLAPARLWIVPVAAALLTAALCLALPGRWADPGTWGAVLLLASAATAALAAGRAGLRIAGRRP